MSSTSAPQVPDPGEALVRVLTVGICGTDLHAFEGTQPFFTYPRILGHELAVEIVQVGYGVEGFKAGDHCAVNPYLNCGACSACRRGRTNCCAGMQVIGVHTDGGMRDSILLPAKLLYKCEKLPPVQIPLVETLGVGIHAVGRAAAQPDDRAIVLGAGPIGLSVMEFLKLAGADIGVVEKIPERLDFARKHHGLSRYFPSHEEARQEEPSMLVFDCTGDKESMDSSIQLLQQGGTLVFVGLINDRVSLFDPDLHRREATILASRNSTAAEHRRVLEAMESGRIDVSPWPTDFVKPDVMSARFPLWLRRQAGVLKAVVDWQ
ncbi:MAG: alcohol dehydrogenase catalytic domain-containing protein [Acidobacteria bacterium]|nr:alcohol dehydrogenase catalytic domain-containing protein [Acidobacteriota bacterium]